MATHTLGTASSSSLTAVKYSAALSDADVATIDQLIFDDFDLVNPVTGAQPGFVLSGTTSTGTNTITSTTVSSPAGGLLSGLVNSFIFGPGIPAGAIVIAASGTTLTISGNATASATVTMAAISRAAPGAFSKQGQLIVPNRGVLQLQPNDIVGVGATGEVVVVPQSASQVTGSVWTFT